MIGFRLGFICDQLPTSRCQDSPSEYSTGSLMLEHQLQKLKEWSLNFDLEIQGDQHTAWPNSDHLKYGLPAVFTVSPATRTFVRQTCSIKLNMCKFGSRCCLDGRSRNQSIEPPHSEPRKACVENLCGKDGTRLGDMSTSFRPTRP